MIRSLLYVVVFYLNTAVFLVFGFPLLFGKRSWAMVGLRAHSRASLWWLRMIVGTRMEVRGLEHLPEGPVLVVAKHQSAWDTFALIPLLDDPAMVMKAELALIPFYGWFCRKFDHIFVERKRGPVALRKLIKDARARAQNGRQIFIFPEGTRRPPRAKPDYKPGVLALYEGLELPCVPLALNSGLYWPRRSLHRYPGTIIVEFLEPIPPGLPRKEFQSRMVETIENATEILIKEAGASAHPPPMPPLKPEPQPAGAAHKEQT